LYNILDHPPVKRVGFSFGLWPQPAKAQTKKARPHTGTSFIARGTTLLAESKPLNSSTNIL